MTKEICPGGEMVYTRDLPRTTQGAGYPALYVVLDKIYVLYLYFIKLKRLEIVCWQNF